MVAAISLSTEFLAPPTVTVPVSGPPGRTAIEPIPSVCSPDALAGGALVGRGGGPRPVPAPLRPGPRGRGGARTVRPSGGTVPTLRAGGVGRGRRLDHRGHDLPARDPLVRLGVRAADPA